VIRSIARIALLSLVGAVPCGAAELQPWRGGPAPDLELRALDGSAHRLADYRGRVVLVNFWATWCAPCREEMTSMRALQTRLAGRPFVILLVNYGEARARISEFVQRESLAFPILLDPNQEAPRAWRVRVLPSSFLVDPGGRVRYGVIGEIDWANVETANIVQELLR
jgi:peroxiredoxin